MSLQIFTKLSLQGYISAVANEDRNPYSREWLAWLCLSLPDDKHPNIAFYTDI